MLFFCCSAVPNIHYCGQTNWMWSHIVRVQSLILCVFNYFMQTVPRSLCSCWIALLRREKKTKQLYLIKFLSRPPRFSPSQTHRYIYNQISALKCMWAVSQHSILWLDQHTHRNPLRRYCIVFQHADAPQLCEHYLQFEACSYEPELKLE